jgi:Spy/CpxP family protein refolding chaperone
MNKPWVVILAFLGVFAAGTVSGTLLGARYGRQIFPRTRPSGGNYSQQLMQRFSEQLSLTADQAEKIRPIVERAQVENQRLRRENVQQMTKVMDEMHTQISEILTPEQRVKMEELRKRFRERSERLRREYRGGDRGDRSPRP